ncbi:MAG: glycosyltransferase [Alphaproteobacteria bacterium]|nr:glycosyltransferase [Alphaproteobacteria bacterium]
MKITLLVHRLTGGGAERVAALWATGFVKRGHEVSIIVNTNAKRDTTFYVPDSVKIYSLGVKVNHVKLRAVLNKIRNLFYSRQKRMSKLLHELKPDVIIGVLPPWAYEAYQVTKDMNVCIINTEHNSFERPSCAPMSKEVEIGKFETNKIFNHVTVLTQADKDVIGNTLQNVSVLPNPLTFEPVEKVPSKKKVILASGRIDAWHYKGFDILIKAFALMCKKYPEWKLQIAGTGKADSFNFLKNLAKTEGIPDTQIEFLGFCDNIQALYQRSSIFVLSSRYEGFGMVLIEAMSQGCASIACDYKGRQSEIITDNTQGITCPVEDVEALANAMTRMIEDDEYRMQCQYNAVERSKYYSLDNTMNRWEEIFNKLNLKG